MTFRHSAHPGFFWVAFTVLCLVIPRTVCADVVELKDGTAYHGKKVSDLGAKIGFMTDKEKVILINKSDIKRLTKGDELPEKSEESDGQAGGQPDSSKSEHSSRIRDSKLSGAARRSKAILPVRGTLAKNFTAYDFSGKRITLSDYRGKVVLLHFWSTGYSPCFKEMPTIKGVYNKYKDKGLVVISIGLEPNQERLEYYGKKLGIEWIQIRDNRPREGDLSNLYRVSGVPENLLIDREGIIRYRNLRSEKLEQAVAALLDIAPAK
jgi:peroxiredoxin